MTDKTKIFVNKAIATHGYLYLYLYHLVLYIHSMQKVEIVCTDHGSFWQEPNSHLNGRGCPHCAKLRGGLKRRLDTGEMVRRAKSNQEVDYNYAKAVYVTNYVEVDIECPFHGWFKTAPARLMKGVGCIQCGVLKCAKAQTSDTEEFIKKAIAIHGHLYDYSFVEYVKNNINVTLYCKIHGKFEQSPANHLNGKGCSKCQSYGYSRGKAGSFYVLKHDNIIKVGVTNRPVKDRVRNISVSSKKDFSIVSALLFDDGEIPWNIEKKCLTWLRAQYSNPEEVFDGSTECFLDVDLAALLNFITPLANPATA